MKATMSKDGLNRLTVTFKKRVSLWDLLVVAVSHTEQTDQYLVNITEIKTAYIKCIEEYGQFWDSDIWGVYFVSVFDKHIDYYIGVLDQYFSAGDITEARKCLDSYRTN